MAKGFCKNHYESIWRGETNRKHKREYDLKHKGEKKKYNKRYFQEHREKMRNFHMLYRHGLSLEQIDQMLIKQNHKCQICGESLIETKRNIDHDHKTNVIRGILCDFCNVGIGYFHDDPEILKKAIDYLHESQNLLSGSCPNLRPRNRSSVLTEDPSDPNGRMSKESIRSFSLTGKGHGGVRQPKHRQPDN